MAITPGQRVKHWRELRNLAQLELAQRADMDNARLSRIENGKTEVRAEEVERLAKAMDLTMPEFYGAIAEAKADEAKVSA